MGSAGRKGVPMAPPGVTPGVGMGDDHPCLCAGGVVAYPIVGRPVYAGVPVYYGSTARGLRSRELRPVPLAQCLARHPVTEAETPRSIYPGRIRF
jgi:hypothetical protein